MIGSVKGKVAFLKSDHCIIETAGGVGYRVYMPAAHLAQLTQEKDVRVFIHTAVREDAILLYGFLSTEYFDLFLLLLTVSGIGPKMALGILSAVRPEEFYLAVKNRDVKILTKLPGIGKKTAERMLVELKDKVGGSGEAEFAATPAVLSSGQGNNVEDAMEALLSLGYTNNEIIPAIKKVEGYNLLASDELLRQTLKLLAGR